ncbi:MAG: hypothetical protein RLZ62_1227 [Bacteroidota bacterium]|jgi:hypothetical protein
MKRIALVLPALFFFCAYARTQSSFGKFIVGIESGFDVAQFSEGLKAQVSPYLQAEVPFWKFSIGAGFGKKYYPDYEFYTSNGAMTEREVNGAIVRFYLADLHAFKPQYWIVPLKVNFRVHKCDCVWLHAGMIFDIADKSKPDEILYRNAEFDQPVNQGVTSEQLTASRTQSVELGIGFNLFQRDRFRLTARPAYVLSRNPEIYNDAPDWLPTLRFSFTAQAGLW